MKIKLISKGFLIGALSVLAPWAQAGNITSCVLAHPMSCHDCTSRVEASCSDAKLQGAIDGSIKAEKIELKIINKKNGTERLVVIDKASAKVSELNNELGLKLSLKDAKIQLEDFEQAEIASIWIPTNTKFYKTTTGKALAGQLKANAQRNIASSPEGGKLGGLQRALSKDSPQKTDKQKQESK